MNCTKCGRPMFIGGDGGGAGCTCKTTPTDKPSYPPRVFLQVEWAINFGEGTHTIERQTKSQKEYISEPEHLAIVERRVADARAEAFEEAACDLVKQKPELDYWTHFAKKASAIRGGSWDAAAKAAYHMDLSRVLDGHDRGGDEK